LVDCDLALLSNSQMENIFHDFEDENIFHDFEDENY
jgi:hypothetical protein